MPDSAGKVSLHSMTPRRSIRRFTRVRDARFDRAAFSLLASEQAVAGFTSIAPTWQLCGFSSSSAIADMISSLDLQGPT
jgi:ABC-type uncharacterized transport system permease subunit